MSASDGSATTAQRVADVLRDRLPADWTVFGERSVHHEVHLNGRKIEMVRGPISLSGYAVRVFRPRDGALGIGSASSNRLTPDGIRAAGDSAEALARHASFPAPSIELPSEHGTPELPDAVDAAVRDRPLEASYEFIEALLAEDRAGSDVVPSFGSVRVTLSETSVVNSAGADQRARSTLVEFEWALKAMGGPEGAPPGECWITRTARRLSPVDLHVDLEAWKRTARDARRAKPPSAGPQPVIFPPEVLHDILPAVAGFRVSGSAERRHISTPVGEVMGSELLTLRDEPHLAAGVGSAPFDDDGGPTRSRALIERGVVRAHLYDALHAAALRQPSTASARRTPPFGETWFRFASPVAVVPSNLTVEAGTGGSVAELGESIEDGILLDQLGYAFPDATGGTFGGEIRMGYRIHRGKLGEPVRGGIVGGLVLGPVGSATLMGGVTAVGSVPKLVGAFRSPPLRVEGLTVAGS
jgi:predicted Zn-dependent protease